MPKKKGTPGGNPNPVKTPEFLAHVFPPAPDVPTGVKLGEPVAVALPLEIDTVIRGLDNRSVWLRRVICEAARSELLGQSPSTPPIAPPPVSPAGNAERVELLEVVNHALTAKTQSTMRSALNRLKTYLEHP